MADTRKYTGYEEEFELSNNQKIKIDNTVNSIINDITTEILEKNCVSEQDDPNNVVYWRIYNNIKGKLVNWQISWFITYGLNKKVKPEKEYILDLKSITKHITVPNTNRVSRAAICPQAGNRNRNRVLNGFLNKDIYESAGTRKQA